jgi:hypothetical protein
LFCIIRQKILYLCGCFATRVGEPELWLICFQGSNARALLKVSYVSTGKERLLRASQCSFFMVDSGSTTLPLNGYKIRIRNSFTGVKFARHPQQISTYTKICIWRRLRDFEGLEGLSQKIFYNRETIPFISNSPLAKNPSTLSWLAKILELTKLLIIWVA